jgi:hypothetical protein
MPAMSQISRILAPASVVAFNLLLAFFLSLVVGFAGIGPPSTGLANGFWIFLCAFIISAVGIGVTHFLSRRAVAISLLIASVLFCVSVAAYLKIYNANIWLAPDGTRSVMGRELLDTAKLLMEKYQWSDEETRQKAKNWDLHYVYTSASISLNEWLLMLSWLAMFFCLFAAIILVENLYLFAFLSGAWIALVPARNDSQLTLAFESPVAFGKESSMPLPGVTLKAICDAFEQAFDRDDLKLLVAEKMDVRLDKLTGPNTRWDVAVFEVVTWAEKRGRTTELIRAGYESNPTHPAMLAVYQTYGLTGVDFQKSGQPAESRKASEGGFEKTIKDRLPAFDFAAFREKMALVENRVCRVELDGNAAGTGFLVGPDAVLTNYHVLESVVTGATQPARVTCRFGYKVLPDGSRPDGDVVGLDAANWLLDFSKYSPAEQTADPDNPPPSPDELDYALVKLARPIGKESVKLQDGASGPRGWLPLSAAPPNFVPQMPLMIAQHPDGKPLKLAVDTDSVIGVNAGHTRVRYATNTEAGSSGSPVFDLSWNLVALHHFGDPAYHRVPAYNQGVPIDKIRTRLASKQAAAAALGT